jgi:hypothetical protein
VHGIPKDLAIDNKQQKQLLSACRAVVRMRDSSVFGIHEQANLDAHGFSAIISTNP